MSCLDITLSFHRFFSDLHVVGPSSSELVGVLSCVWAALMWTRPVHYHPDSDSHSMCKKTTLVLMLLRFCRKKSIKIDDVYVCVCVCVCVCIHRPRRPQSCTTCLLFWRSPPFSAQVNTFTVWYHSHMDSSGQGNNTSSCLVQVFSRWEEDAGSVTGGPWRTRARAVSDTTVQLSHVDIRHCTYKSFMGFPCQQNW